MPEPLAHAAMTAPGNFAVELTGGRWDGTVLEVPLAASVVWVEHEWDDVFEIDHPIYGKGRDPKRQLAYGITPHRCVEHGITIARYVKPPA